MYKVKEVEIRGFWGSRTVRTPLNDDVNIIIGDNGSGKTTFMSILQAALTVDLEWLHENDFKEVKLTLVNGDSRKTVLVSKTSDKSGSVGKIKYKISKKTYDEIILISDLGRHSPLARRRVQESSESIRNEMLSILKVSSLSVYRSDLDVDDIHRASARKKWISAVDERLDSLVSKLNEYQLSLSSEARRLSSDLQREVLLSLLATKKRAAKLGTLVQSFDENSELKRLISAYENLGIYDEEAKNKIKEYVRAIGSRVSELRRLMSLDGKGNQIVEILYGGGIFDSLQSARDVAERSVKHEQRIKEVFSHSRKFLEIVNEFVRDKKFEFADDGFRVAGSDFPLRKLSSGEKQLLIILSEAMLQKNEKRIFIADEPEISLHISWQRRIVKDVMELNHNAQIIVATHSPEIAAGFSDKIIDMEDMFCA